ncbi:MAG: L,D-transpeptidase [Hyphomicrobium sp.]
MLRIVCSALIGLAAISSSPALGEEQPAAAPSPAVVVGEPAEVVAEAAAKPAPPPTTLTAMIDLAQQRMIVLEGGVEKYIWPISSGTAEFPTPRGTYRPEWTAKMWYSRKYDMAPMPHAVFINGGVAVHATYHTGALGSPASHGCIRLAPANAKTFYNLVHRHGLKATKVAVYGTPKWRAPAIATRKPKRVPPVAVAQNDFWFFGAPLSYPAESAYNPSFTKKKYRAVKPRSAGYAPAPSTRVIRRKSAARIVYVQ